MSVLTAMRSSSQAEMLHAAPMSAFGKAVDQGSCQSMIGFGPFLFLDTKG
jgi:hypothetical protein